MVVVVVVVAEKYLSWREGCTVKVKNPPCK